MRVSTAGQELGGYSPNSRKTSCSNTSTARSTRGGSRAPSGSFFDVGSGSELEGRTQLQRLLEVVRAGEVESCSCGRSTDVADLSDLLRCSTSSDRRHVGFASTKETWTSPGRSAVFIYQVFGALAEFERETIKMRTEKEERASALAGN